MRKIESNSGYERRTEIYGFMKETAASPDNYAYFEYRKLEPGNRKSG
ncbi:MAG: hypothetical protein II719_01180 [Clostridia bacterium]|nr:hypothetical protein [Clostridia bacterium]